MAQKKKIMMEILLRAEEAKRAAEKLKEAERRSKAAKLAWTKTMTLALENSKREQERIRLEVEQKISHGAEAARIKAEA